jgi:hypothetical protein
MSIPLKLFIFVYPCTKISHLYFSELRYQLKLRRILIGVYWQKTALWYYI